MKTSRFLSYLGLAVLVSVGWMALNVSTGAALPLLGLTPTPTDTPPPTPTSTPATPTDTPPPLTHTPTSTPPPGTPPPSQETPPPVELTPAGPEYLPETGQADLMPFGLLLVAIVGLFALGIWLPGRSRCLLSNGAPLVERVRRHRRSTRQ
jgi:hypothetical protein